MKNKFLFLLSVSLLINTCIFAQSEEVITKEPKHDHIEKFYVGSALDAGIFSTATIKQSTTNYYNGQTSTTNSTGTIRFSYVINLGVTFNYNFGSHFGMYTGIDLKNVGFIEKYDDGVTGKYRTYNLGAPLGIKVGNLRRKGTYLFLGGGLDVPVNYKQKVFTNRSNKQKFNEWFSDRTPAVMPYVFIGAKFKNNCTLKFQYYTNNFLNPDFSTGTAQPYAGYNVHLLLFSIGYDMHYTKHKDMVKSSLSSLKTNIM